MERVLALHCAHWDANAEVQNVGGRMLSRSMVTWLRAVTAELCEEDDPRTTADFPLVRIHPSWLHEPPEPILRMDMRSLMDALTGLEWHVFSDPGHRPRVAAWWRQVKSMAKLLFYRCVHFVQHDAWELSVLNVESYRETTDVDAMALYNAHAGTASDELAAYASDDEGEAPVRPFRSLAPTLAQTAMPSLIVQTARVSEVWIYDVDAIFSNFWLEAQAHDTAPPVDESVPARPDIARLRKFLFDFAAAVTESEVVRSRRVWFEELLLTDSYRRIFRRTSPFNARPAAREIILSKSDLVYPAPCTTFKEITTRLVKGDVSLHMRVSTDALFEFHSRSLALGSGDLYKALFAKSRRAVHTSTERDSVLFPCIYRDPIGNFWEVACRRGVYARDDSFTGAFARLRAWQRLHGVSAEKGAVRLDVLDAHIFHEPASAHTTAL